MYPPNTQCYWYIHAPIGQVIDLRFKFLDLEIEDTVSFYNGHRLHEGFCINKYSGLKNHTELSSIFIRSTGNTMLVSFEGNGPFSNRGFVSYYWTHVCLPYSYGQDTCNLTCNCIHENSIGCDSISGFCNCKPGWSHKDCSQAQCKSTTCKYECKVISTTLWTEQCSCPKRLLTLTNKGDLHCSEYYGCNTNSSDPSGYLSSPGFPIEFPGCYWRIVTEPGSVVALTFSMEINSLSVRCGKNYVSIIDEKTVDQPTIQICLNTKGWIQTSSNVMLIVFHGSILERDAFGFSGRYNSHSCPKFTWGFDTCLNKCSCIEQNTEYCNSETGKCVCKNGYSSHDCSFGTVPSTPCETLNERSGFLILRRSRNSNSSILCWLLHGVGISISKYSNQYVGSDDSYIKKPPLLVYDGNSNASPLLQGMENTTFLKATGTEMLMELKESFDHSKDLYLNYTTQSSVCGGTLISSFGHISSPQYPQKYPDYSDCRWTLVVYENQFISLRITDLKLEQQVNCDNDYLDVYDGSSNTAIRIGHFCQSAVPIIINSTSNFMHIVFHTDRSIAERGFHADFQAVECPQHWAKGCVPSCSCHVHHTFYCDINTGQCVCQPGWTGYDCRRKVDLCSSNSCPGNTTCETEDGVLSCRSCNVSISSESGHLWIPDYEGNSYKSPEFCFWTINGPANSVVTLRFQDFNFLYQLRFIWNVMVYDGNSTDSTLLGKYIEGGASGIVRSTDNTMHVVLAYEPHDRRGFIASFSSHACNPFTYGQTCENQCDCEINNTQHCDNLTGFCICKEPWLGHKCTEKKDPCLLQDITFKCPEDQVCINNNDMHSCVCRQGYVMNGNQKCEVQRACIRNRGLCSHYCIINAVGKEECTCPHNMILGVDKITCVVPFYPNGPDANDLYLLRNEADKTNTISQKVNLELAIPFGNHLYDSLFVMSNGVVSFGTSVLPKEPSIAKATERKINLIAPFWTKTNPQKGSIWYNVYKRCGEELHSFKSHSHKQVFSRAAQDIKTLFHLGDFDVQMVLVFTWSDLSPENSEGNETTSFQMIFASGYKNGNEFAKNSYDSAESAYALMIYKKDQMNWIYKRNRVIQFGYTIAGGEYLNITSETNNLIHTLPEQDLEDTGLKGVWAYQVGSVSSAAQKCQRYTCHHSALPFNAKYQRDINELHRCPCSRDRLGRQWWPLMFRSFDSISYYYYILRNFTMKILFPNNSRNRICTYKSTMESTRTERKGFHETYSYHAGHILISSDQYSKENELNLKAHDWCCLESNKPAVCEKFYSIFPNSGCSNIVPFISNAQLLLRKWRSTSHFFWTDLKNID